MPAAIEKPSVCQRKRRCANCGNWGAHLCEAFYEARDLPNFSSHPRIPAGKDQDTHEIGLDLRYGQIRENSYAAHTGYDISFSAKGWAEKSNLPSRSASADAGPQTAKP